LKIFEKAKSQKSSITKNYVARETKLSNNKNKLGIVVKKQHVFDKGRSRNTLLSIARERNGTKTKISIVKIPRIFCFAYKIMSCY